MLTLPDVGASAVAVDTETTGLHPDPPELGRVSVVSVAWMQEAGPVRSAVFPFGYGWSHGGQGALAFEDDPNLTKRDWDKLLAWLATRRLVFASAKFDLTMLAAGAVPGWEGADLSAALRWDVQVASRELDPGLPADLGELEARLELLTPEQRVKWRQQKKQRNSLERMGWADAERYAGTDAEVTIAAFSDQMRRIEEGEGRQAHVMADMELTRNLFTIERRGIGYDAPRSIQAAQAVAKAEAKIRAALPFKATPDGARRWFFTTNGYTPESETPTGKPRVNEQQIAKLVAQGAPGAAEYQQLKKLETARSKWYESYATHCGTDGRLRTSFSLAKVVSGRLSSTRVNLQAIPRDYELADVVALGFPTPRSLFRARTGAQLWELDLSQAELRVAAVEANCTPMLEMIHDGADIHGQVTQLVLGDTPGSETWERSRQVGKRADFSFIFGVGAEEFQASLVRYADIWLPLGECSAIVQRWRRSYPEYGRAIRLYMNRADQRGWIRLVNGRPRFFSSWEDRHKAFNQYVQGSLAELMKAWQIEAERQWPGVIVLSIHDSMVLETGDTGIVASVRQLGEKMGTEMFRVPMVVDCKRWSA